MLSILLSSMIRLSPTTSVANFRLPSLSSQLLVLNRPSIYTGFFCVDIFVPVLLGLAKTHGMPFGL